MTMEGVLGHLLSSLANGSQELTRESLENDRPPRLNGLFDKRHRLLMRWRTRLIDCAAVRACEGCSRPIRRWDRRVLMTDQGYIHQSCWEDGEFFRELVRHYDPNLIGPAFPEAPDLRRAAWLIESIVRSFYDEAQRNRKDSPQSEYLRGMLGGAKSMLGGLRGQGPKEWVLGEVRKRVGKPLPSVIPLARGTEIVTAGMPRRRLVCRDFSETQEQSLRETSTRHRDQPETMFRFEANGRGITRLKSAGLCAFFEYPNRFVPVRACRENQPRAPDDSGEAGCAVLAMWPSRCSEVNSYEARARAWRGKEAGLAGGEQQVFGTPCVAGSVEVGRGERCEVRVVRRQRGRHSLPSRRKAARCRVSSRPISASRYGSRVFSGGARDSI
jgi:hypothetical protein